MINKVVSGVCIALYKTFGDKYSIYKEEIKQGLQEPCFFVDCIIPKRTKVLNNRYYRENTFSINYFPKSNNYRKECNEVLEKMYGALEYIMVDNSLVMGKNLNFDFSDGVMIVTINFDFHTFEYTKDKENNLMEELICI